MCFFSAPLIFGSEKLYLYLDIQMDNSVLSDTLTTNFTTFSTSLVNHLKKHLINGLQQVFPSTYGTMVAAKVQLLTLVSQSEQTLNSCSPIIYRIYSNVVFDNAIKMKQFIVSNLLEKMVFDDTTVDLKKYVNTSCYTFGSSFLRYFSVVKYYMVRRFCSKKHRYEKS